MDNYISEIRLFPWNWAPKYWALCNGALLPIAQNQALFSLLGTTYGGDGIRTFGLPDLQGRAALHFGNGSGGAYALGQFSGTETVTLTTNELPMHNHLALAVAGPGNQQPPADHYLANNSGSNAYYGPHASVQPLNPASMSITGQGVAHENMQPYLVLNYCICTQGVFPSRN